MHETMVKDPQTRSGERIINETEKGKMKKVLIICSKGSIEDVYATLIMANGALMEGIEAKVFFTFFGLNAISRKGAGHLHTATVGNPAFMPALPTMVGGLPGFEALASHMMKKQMAKLDIPDVKEFLQMIDASGGEIYACKLAAEMFGLKRDDFVPEVRDIITVGDMYALANGEGTQIIFI
jgi:peroxiredoxin family protein